MVLMTVTVNVTYSLPSRERRLLLHQTDGRTSPPSLNQSR